MSAGKVNYIKKVLFRIKWLTMSDRERYAYLWRQTKDSLYSGYRLLSVW